MSQEIKSLKNIIKAWDSLPEGNYSPKKIEDWLVNEMHPAIADARQLINKKVKQEFK